MKIRGFTLLEVLLACGILAGVLGYCMVKFVGMSAQVAEDRGRWVDAWVAMEAVKSSVIHEDIESVSMGRRRFGVYEMDLKELDRVGDPVLARRFLLEVYNSDRIVAKSEFVKERGVYEE